MECGNVAATYGYLRNVIRWPPIVSNLFITPPRVDVSKNEKSGRSYFCAIRFGIRRRRTPLARKIHAFVRCSDVSLARELSYSAAEQRGCHRTCPATRGSDSRHRVRLQSTESDLVSCSRRVCVHPSKYYIFDNNHLVILGIEFVDSPPTSLDNIYFASLREPAHCHGTGLVVSSRVLLGGMAQSHAKEAAKGEHMREAYPVF